VIFFDVGQGDAALIQGRRAVVLVDTGPGRPGGVGGASLVRGLRAAGVKRIDLMVLTHGDLDHRGGLVRVFETFEVGQLWLPDATAYARDEGHNQARAHIEAHDEALSQAAAMARRHGTDVVWQAAGRSGRTRRRLADEVDLEVLWPVKGGPAVGSSRNENSLVLRVVLDERAFLFVADIGSDVERQLIRRPGILAADVLKVAHHGSRGSSSAEFLRRVSAEVAVLSAPCDPTRGLPNGQAIERIQESGARLAWTGRDGALIVTGRPGASVSIMGWGRPRKCSAR
jgi:competence protein ComEC